MKKCTNGHPVDDNAKFCPQCGAEIVGAKYCSKCGKELEGTAKFCPQCGTPYGQTPTNYISEQSINHSKNSKKRLLIAAIAAAVVLAIGGATWYFLTIRKDYSLEGLAKAAVNYDVLFPFHEGMASVEKDDKLGVIDKMGNEIVRPIYDYDLGFLTTGIVYHEGMAHVQRNGKHGFVDQTGEEVVPCKYDGAWDFSEGLAKVRLDGKDGFIDKSGKMVIPCIYKDASSFSEGLALVENDSGCGYIDREGKVIIPFKYGTKSSGFSEGLAAVETDNGVCYIDKKGNIVIETHYIGAGSFSCGLAKVTEDYWSWGFIDKEGNEIIPCTLTQYRGGPVEDFIDGYLTHYDTSGILFFDITGKELHRCEYYNNNQQDLVSDGILFECSNGKYGLFDLNDNKRRITPNEFDEVRDFSEGLAAVMKDDKFGYINNKGEVVIPFLFDWAGEFSEGLAVVMKDGVYGFVDTKGNSTFDVQDEEVRKIVQAKIQEKEEQKKIEEERRAEEERKAEEERRRYEEQNKWGLALYRLASSSTPKQIAYSCQVEYDRNYASRSIVTYAVFLYPNDEKSGVAHFVQYKANVITQNGYSRVENLYHSYPRADKYYKTTLYQVSNRELYFYDSTVKLDKCLTTFDETVNLIFDIADDGNSLRLKSNGMYFRRGFEGTAPYDPFNR